MYLEDISNTHVGDGVTLHLFSDSQAYTIVEIISDKTIVIQRDKVTRTNRDKDHVSVGGFAAHVSTDGAQEWSYERDPDGKTYRARRRSDGRWYTPGSSFALSVGRHEHYDYNF